MIILIVVQEEDFLLIFLIYLGNHCPSGIHRKSDRGVAKFLGLGQSSAFPSPVMVNW